MTSVSSNVTSQSYFQPTTSNSTDPAKQSTTAKTGGGGGAGGAKSAASAASSSSSSSSSSSTESASTENADGTYGPDHTAAPPAGSVAASELAEKKQLSGSQTGAQLNDSSAGVNILA